MGSAGVRAGGGTAATRGATQAPPRKAGIEHGVAHSQPGDQAGYCPGSETVHRVASFAPDGTLLGAQGVGRAGVWEGGQVVGRGAGPDEDRALAAQGGELLPDREERAGVGRRQRQLEDRDVSLGKHLDEGHVCPVVEAAGLVPVHTVDGRRIGTGARGPVVERLQALYQNLVARDVAVRVRP